MADFVDSVAEEMEKKAAKCLVTWVNRHCGYLMFSNRNVRQLKSALEKLDDERIDVEDSIDEARDNMRRIKPKVERWVKKVETITNKAHDVLKYDGTAKKTCFCWCLPNPKVRYVLGKEASRTVKDIQELIQQCQFKKVYIYNRPTGRVVSSPDVNLLVGNGDNTITGSRAPTFQGIMNALDDEKHNMGKTKLFSEVEKKLGEEGRPVKMIVKAEVSQATDVDDPTSDC